MFWNSSLRTLFRELVVLKYRTEDRRDEAMVQAYTIAALTRATKLPALKTLLTKHQKPQTVAEKLNMLQAVSEATGIPLRKRKKDKKKNRG